MEQMPGQDEIRKALEVVIDPELHRSIVELDMVRSIETSPNGVVDVTVSLTTPGLPDQGALPDGGRGRRLGAGRRHTCQRLLRCAQRRQKAALQQKLGRGSLPAGALAQVSNVICIGSGKGGVGKSTLTANLAAALAAEGRRVGMLDADVWGYSIPRMYGLGSTRPSVSAERKIIPLQAHGVKVMSIGFFVEEDAAVVWRGPMLHKALTQFLQDVEWGVARLPARRPPARYRRRLDDARPAAPPGAVPDRHHAPADRPEGRPAGGADGREGRPGDRRRDREHVRLHHPVGERFAIFGEGGGQELADELDVPVLGRVPLTMPLREQADAGTPLVVEDPDDPAAQAIRQAARGLLAVAPPSLPTLPLVEVAAPAAESRKPVGMSLPMA